MDIMNPKRTVANAPERQLVGHPLHQRAGATSARYCIIVRARADLVVGPRLVLASAVLLALSMFVRFDREIVRRRKPFSIKCMLSLMRGVENLSLT